jgi:broad specificity phosphatase PhoE
MTIVLVRHGETTGNASRVVQPPETPLNEAGLRQAERVAERLVGMGVGHILCSDLPRARMTAEALARRTGLALDIEPLLQERNFGDLRGTPYDQLPDGHPFGPDLDPPNGETWTVFHERVARAFAQVLARRASTHGNLVVVTHGLVLSSIVEHLVPCAPGLHPPAKFDNVSITLLDDSPPHTARLVNDTTHLGADQANLANGAV